MRPRGAIKQAEGLRVIEPRPSYPGESDCRLLTRRVEPRGFAESRFRLREIPPAPQLLRPLGGLARKPWKNRSAPGRGSASESKGKK
jgi:hypothetical protein